MARTLNYLPDIAPVWVSDTAKLRSAHPKHLLGFAASLRQHLGKCCSSHGWGGFHPREHSSQQLNPSSEDCLAQQQVRPAKSLTSRLLKYQCWGTNHSQLSLQPRCINEQHCITNYC